MARAEFDRYSENYSQNVEEAAFLFGKQHSFFVRSKADSLLSAFAEIDKDISEIKVLDIGCGVGLVHPYILGSVGQLEGVDVSAASIEVARKANPTVSYKEYDGLTLPYPNGSFDCAYAICVMHHVPVDQWSIFLCEMRRVVRKGGLVLVIEHNPLNPMTQWVVRTNEIDANAVLLRPWTLRMLMKSVGIAPTWIRYVLFTPFAGAFFRRIDRALARVPFGTQYVVGGRT